MYKWMVWAVLAMAVTWWQVGAGIARCGTVDGGVLLVPLVALAAALAKGVTRDLSDVFSGTSPQERGSEEWMR